MKAADVVIAWTPALTACADLPRSVEVTAGEVAVLFWPANFGALERYARMLGGPEPGWRTAESGYAAARLRVAFRTLVIRDGLNPLVVHTAFIQIDEYRAQILREEKKIVRPRPLPLEAQVSWHRVA